MTEQLTGNLLQRLRQKIGVAPTADKTTEYATQVDDPKIQKKIMNPESQLGKMVRQQAATKTEQ